MGPDPRVARLAVTAGIVGYLSVTSLAVFFAVAGPFGTINDVGNALFGILSAALAIALRPVLDGTSTATLATGAAIVGAGLTVVGSALVISGATGFFLAGLVSSVGFAFIGLWLIAAGRSMASRQGWPPRLATLAIVAGVTMAIGFVTAPGIALGLDDMDNAPGWVWIGFIGWLGAFFLFPGWWIWLGRVVARWRAPQRTPD